MTTLHMDTEIVRAAEKQIQLSMEHMLELTQTVSNQTQQVDWIGASRDEFEMEIQQALRQIQSQVQQGVQLGERLDREVAEWETTASTLSGAYGGLLRLIRATPLPSNSWLHAISNSSVAVGGAVLGAAVSVNKVYSGGPGMSASTDYASRYESMNWSDKFSEEQSLDSEISKAAALVPSNAAEQLQNYDREIASVESQIASIEAKRAEADQKAKGFVNQVIPDLPLQADRQDGVPWRVKADDYQDQVQEYDRQLAELQKQKASLTTDRNALQIKVDHLADLNSQKAALENVIHNGIAADGPSAKHPYFPGTDASNCTKYASSQRNVPCSGNAYQWNEQAQKAGYDVGYKPVKGSVIVFEPDPKGKVSDKTYGHVAIVDNVQDLGNGKYSISISEGGWPGEKTIHHRTIEVSGSSKDANCQNVPISYIYGKK